MVEMFDIIHWNCIAICREPVDIGTCSSGNYKRFYYDDEHQTCRAFVYTGCGGNRNNFKTVESCLKVCRRKWLNLWI